MRTMMEILKITAERMSKMNKSTLNQYISVHQWKNQISKFISRNLNVNQQGDWFFLLVGFVLLSTTATVC